MPVKWNSETHEKLLKAILAHTDVKIDNKAVATLMGDEFTAVAITLQMGKLKREAKARVAASNKRGAFNGEDDEVESSLPKTPNKKSKVEKAESSTQPKKGRPKKNTRVETVGPSVESSGDNGEDTKPSVGHVLKLGPEAE